jgi:predicted RNA-binding Zn-ribbon protein involved in translation (DUF1610 family)
MEFKMTVEEFRAASDGYEGRCVICGATRYNCEPDARKYDCPECGENAVYGLEELLIMGKIEITGEQLPK